MIIFPSFEPDWLIVLPFLLGLYLAPVNLIAGVIAIFDALDDRRSRSRPMWAALGLFIAGGWEPMVVLARVGWSVPWWCWLLMAAIALPLVFVGALLGIGITRVRNFSPPGCCLNCGYDLRGNVSGHCPECGLALPAPGSPAVAR